MAVITITGQMGAVEDHFARNISEKLYYQYADRTIQTS